MGVFEDILGSFGDMFYTDNTEGNPEFDIVKAGGIGAALANIFGGGSGGSNPPYGVVGYGGDVPRYTASRSQVPNTYDPNRRPGSGGQRYFSDMRYAPLAPTLKGARTTPLTPEQEAVLSTTQGLGQKQAAGLAALNAANPAQQRMPSPPVASNDTLSALPEALPASSVANKLPATVEGLESLAGFRAGGLAGLKKGKYLDGATDGMADKIPATIDKTQPAALSDGEFVIPADVVSHLGNGNSDAGAKVLTEMMDKVRMARTGNKKQGKEIDPNKFIPKV